MINRPAIKQYQKAIRDRAGDKIAGGKIIKVCVGVRVCPCLPAWLACLLRTLLLLLRLA